MILRHALTHEPIAPGALVTSRDQQTFTLAHFDSDFVHVVPKGKRTTTERYRPHFFGLEVAQ